VRLRLFFSIIFVALHGVAMAQISSLQPKATGVVWLDTFAGPQGIVVYPQYAWSLKTDLCNLSGYGFFEAVAPHELPFTNHLVICTPAKLPQFSIHTETGGFPTKSLGFFQVAPRLNVHETIPALKRPMSYLFVAVLPRFIGIRPNNLLIAGATNRFKILPDVKGSVEGFYRVFGGGRPDYGESWLLLYPKKTAPHLSFAAHLIYDGGRTRPTTISAGIRISQ